MARITLCEAVLIEASEGKAVFDCDISGEQAKTAFPFGAGEQR